MRAGFFMLQIGGIVVLFACVFGGYLMTGGSLGVVFEALPHEMLTIFGAAIAAMLIAGSMYQSEEDRRLARQGDFRARAGSRAIIAICSACCSC